VISGAGKIVLNGTALQTIDGAGIFNNVDLNNTNAAAAPVSLLANMTLNGTLTFVSAKQFNINTYNLRLNSTASISGEGSSSYIKSAGNTGDGGLTKVYTSTVPFTFPVGVANYTPAAIKFNGTPAAYGSLTVIPVNFEHPNVTTPGRSLTYFWRTKSSGFDLTGGSATHGYYYDQSNVVTGGDVSEDEYVAARFDISSSTWTKGFSADVDETNNIIGEPGAGTFLENVAFIDGDFTAGDDDPTSPFGIPTIYYSRINGAAAGSGLWGDINTWSTISHTGVVAGTVPGAGDIVIIGARDSVYLNTNNTVANTDVRSSASLMIERGSALDIGYNPACNFSMVINHTNGNGNFRVTTSWTSGSTYAFPTGDFSDFNVNLGTTELYSTNPAAGTTYWLPNNISSYGNLILSPLGGSNIIFGNTDLTIYGDLVTRGQNADSWFCPNWINLTPYPTAPTVPIAKTITVRGDLDIQGGGLIWIGNGSLRQDIIVNGDVIVAPWGAITAWTGFGGANNQSLRIGGSLINNTNNVVGNGATQTRSWVNFSNGASVVPVTFFGPDNALITHTPGLPGPAGPATIFNVVTVDKGSSQATTLTIDIGGVLTTPADNWLTLTNGTLRYMRNNPGSDFTISTVTPFTIPSTAGLFIDYPNNTGNRNILIGAASNNNGDLLLNGKLTILSGNVYVGPVTSTAFNNDIEYSVGGSSAIDIQGGSLIVNGQIRRNVSNTGGILKYSQSGGTVRVNGQASNTTNAKFEVANDGSDFTMTGGALTIVRGNGAITTPSSPFGDLYLRPQTGSVTGGTIILTQGAIAGAQNYFLDATIPLNNITVTGASVANYAAVRLLASPLTVNGDMTISANSVLNANNINTTFNGNFINTPGLAGYIPGTNLTTFSTTIGSTYAGAQSLTGTTNFYDLTVSPAISLTINNTIDVDRNLSVNTGTLFMGANPVTVQGNVNVDGSYTDNNSVGSGLILNGTAIQQISGTGSFARLTLNNAAGARIENNITLQEDLTMTLGILDIKKNLLTLGTGSLIQGAPFGATKMITSDGVFSNVGLRKFFDPGATTFLYPIGTSGKYTPALLTVTASSTVGYIRINNISSRHPAILDPAHSLDYYWEIQSSGITGFSGSLELNYMESDVAGDESNYLAARIAVPGVTWTVTPGVDPVQNKILNNYAGSNNLSGEYTAGITSAFFTNVPEYTSNADGFWSDETIWSQTAGDPYPCPPGGPNGFIVNVNHVVTINSNFCSAYRLTINNELRVEEPYYGHNFGTVYGNGTLHLERGTFPAGVYTSFLSCSGNGTVDYGGSGTYTIIADLYDNIPNLRFTGTGTRVLPNKDLTICNTFIVDGPIVDNSIYNKKLTIEGSIQRLSGTFRSGSGAGAVVSFAGAAAQTIGGAAMGDFTGTSAFNHLEINNSLGLRINDGGAVEVAGNLMLTNGLINTGAGRTLTIINPGINSVVPSGGAPNSFVDGPLVKRISQYDNFLFPIGIYRAGPGNILGNRLTVSSTQTGPLLWTAEYHNPNSTSTSMTAPLQGVSAQEYFTIRTTPGSQAVVNLNWTPSVDVNPSVAGAMSNIRVVNFDTGSGSWIEIPTTSAGDINNGTASTSSVVTFTAADDYTLGTITPLIPRAQLTPGGPVCGNAGIPVTFAAPGAIPFNYTLNYTINGAAQAPVVITPAMIPYTLPTLLPGTYRLAAFSYNNGAENGVVDATPVAVYNTPTISDAGPDQTQCGISSTNLAGNTPVTGTGLWTIISGSGGTVIAPTSPTSQFIGLNGASYTLRWTISNGTCISFDDVVVNFTILPDAPAAASPQNFCGPATVANLVASPPVGCTVDWYVASTGGSPLALGTALISGNTYWAESNGGGGCMSLSRTPVLVNIYSVPVPGLIGANIVCVGSTGNIYTTEAGMSNYVWTVIGGTITAGGLATDNTATVTWNTAGAQSISVNYTNAGGCTGATSTVYNITVNDSPTIALGTNPSVCSGTTSAELTYSATTGSPNRYSIDYSIAAESAGFVDIPGTTVLPASPISLFVPGAAPSGTYTGDMTVINTLTGCISGTYAISITIIPTNTVSAPSSTPTLCINTALAAITHTTTGATGIGAAVGLPAGVTAAWAANTITISGTPTASGTFNYTIPLTGGCGTVSAAGTITVTPDMTVSVPSSTPTLCINTALAAITHTTTGATGIGAAVGLPAGVTVAWAANTITISGTPTASGTFNYTIPLTGGCGTVSAAGTITVTPDMTVSVPSSTPTLCINTALAAITHTTTGATGIGAAVGLPAGVTAAWAANTITISGTPTASGTFNYTIPLTGGCGTVSAAGTITVTPDMTVSVPSSTPTLCINTALAAITHTTTGATGIGAAVGLPAGVTAAWAANTITISGTPTASGTFNYTIPLTGGCGTVSAAGTITVTPDMTVSVPSSTPTLCINTALAAITHTTTGATGIGAAVGLPAGVTAAWAANTITISGTPTASGAIPLTR
jgi:hypothetical protein